MTGTGNEEQQEVLSSLDENLLGGTEKRPFQDWVAQDVVLRVENEFFERSQSGRRQLCFDCVVVQSTVEGQVGRTYTKRWGLETADNIAWLKRDFEGLDLGEFSTIKDLKEKAAAAVGIRFAAKLVPDKNDEWPPSCYINKHARREASTEGVLALAPPGSGSGKGRF